MKRRAPGQNKMSTARKEADQVEILSGLQDGITTGAPLTGVIYNSDQHSKDYSLLKTNMRPGHSDYPAYIKYKGFNDVQVVVIFREELQPQSFLREILLNKY